MEFVFPSHATSFEFLVACMCNSLFGSRRTRLSGAVCDTTRHCHAPPLPPRVRVVLAEHRFGCTPKKQLGVEGYFLVIERGSCPIVQKLVHAAAAGAAGVVLVDKTNCLEPVRLEWSEVLPESSNRDEAPAQSSSSWQSSSSSSSRLLSSAPTVAVSSPMLLLLTRSAGTQIQ